MNVRVSTVDELTAALKTASGGETILLAPGDYGSFTYFGDDTNWSNGGVTIRSENLNAPAVFTDKFDIRDVHNLTISNVVFDADSLADSANDSRVSFNRSSNITLESIVQRGHLATAEEGFDPYDPAIDSLRDPIEGFPRAIGLRVSQTEGFTLRDSDISEVRVAILLKGVSDVVIENTEIHGVREGLNFTDVDGMLISGNTFRDFRSWLDLSDPAYDPSRHEHPDMIQYWAANATEGIRDITIADNVFEMPQGSSNQSIFGHMQNPAPGVTAENFAILNNLILNGHPNAIWIADVEGGLIAGNVLLPNGTDVEKAWTPRLQLTRDSENFHVVNNAAVNWFTADTLGPRGPGGLAAQNIMVENFQILGHGKNDANYWGNLDIDALRAELRTEPSDLGINVNGTVGDDLLLGKGGDDRLRLGEGNDTATGGYGADFFIIDWAGRGPADVHRITDLDFEEGDQLVFTGWSGGRDLRITSEAGLQSFVADPKVSLSGSTLTLSGGSGPAMTVILAEGASAGSPLPPPPEPSDPGPIDPEPGEPGPANPSTGLTLNGTSANDTLTGTEADDKILLRQGDDTATGAGGADQFILDWRFHWEGDSHTITDLDFAEGDTLVLRSLDSKPITLRDQAGLDALTARDDVSAVQRPDALTLRFNDAGGPDITLRLETQGGTEAPGGAPLKLTGTNGDDTLTGGTGPDSILLRYGEDTATGGAGPDMFIIDARYVWDGDSHSITDLDFAEGDTLVLRFFEGGNVTLDSAAEFDALAGSSTFLTLTDPDGDVLTLSI